MYFVLLNKVFLPQVQRNSTRPIVHFLPPSHQTTTSPPSSTSQPNQTHHPYSHPKPPPHGHGVALYRVPFPKTTIITTSPNTQNSLACPPTISKKYSQCQKALQPSRSYHPFTLPTTNPILTNLHITHPRPSPHLHSLKIPIYHHKNKASGTLP